MKICHIGNLPIEKMGEITREIFDRCEGDHIYWNQMNGTILFDNVDIYKSTPLPIADIYLLHCFKEDNIYYFDFEHPPGENKIISLVHSSFPCRPSRNSDFVVTISRAAEKHLELTMGIKSTMIMGAINLKPFLRYEPDYEFPVMGKISRFEPGKYHNQYFDVLETIQAKYPSEIRIITNDFFPDNDKYLFTGFIDNTAKIADSSSKAVALRKLNIYVDAHAEGNESFKETFCVALLEAMAAGLPCIILGKGQDAMVEVLGDGGIVVDNIYEFYKAIETMVNSEKLRKAWGLKARERAKEFSLTKMIGEYNSLFRAAMDDL